MNDKSLEELANDYKHRFKDYASDLANEADEAPTTDAGQKSLLPTLKDSKLWLVKCKTGTERMVLISMLARHMEALRKGAAPPIKSIIAPEGLKDYFYVEADNEKIVREAINGVRDVFQRAVTLVPINEMVDVLSVKKRKALLEPKMWVRVKNGTYKDDIAQVEEVDESKGVAVIKLVPRLDYGVKEADGKAKRPPPRLFNPDDAEKQRIGLLEPRRDQSGDIYWILNGRDRFKDGYLYKPVTFKGLISQGVFPSLEELEKFKGSAKDESGGQSIHELSALGPRRQVSYQKGDLVRVVEGDLKRLIGIVETVHDDVVTIKPANIREDVELESVQLPITSIQKHFKKGDHVKIIAGTFAGETGMITQLEGNVVSIFSDLTKQILQALVQDIQEASEVASSKLTLGNYALHDLVQLNTGQTIGVIVKIERNSFQILDSSNVVKSVPLEQMQRKLNNRNASSIDGNQNVVSIGDLVQVKDSAAKGRQGRVKHLYKGVVFLYSRELSENSGIFAVKCRSCELLGANPTRRVGLSSFAAGANQARQQGRPPMPAGGGRGKIDLSIVGKTVQIRRGLYKGYAANVKEATDTTVRVELISKAGKKVTLDRQDIVEGTDTARQDRPAVPPTPSRTPARVDPMTPHSYGAAEFDPSQQPRTPGRELTTPYGFSPMANPTPDNPPYSYGWPHSYSNDEFGRSPALQPQTPFFSTTPNLQTPALGMPQTPGISTPSLASSLGMPQTPGLGIPQTPGLGTPALGMPQTPGLLPPQTPGLLPPQTPALGMPQTPGLLPPQTPGLLPPQTPALGMPQTPSTPVPYTPGIPSTPIDYPQDDWLDKQVIVLFSPTFKGGQYKDARGFVKEVLSDGSARVQLLSSGDEVVAPRNEIRPAPPEAHNEKARVRMWRGTHARKEGILQQRDTNGQEGIISIGHGNIIVVNFKDFVVLHNA
jgi:transcription elongation factor SPT5